MRLRILVLATYLACLTLEWRADAGLPEPGGCRARLRSAWEAVGGYAREVRRTRGLRLLLKDASPEPALLLGGLFTEWKPAPGAWFWEPIRTAIQWAPRRITRWATRRAGAGPLGRAKPAAYDFTPIRAAQRALLHLPTRAISRRLLGRELEPTLLVILPLDLYLFVKAYEIADAAFMEQAFERKTEIIAKNAEVYDRLIQSDFRFHSIRKRLARDEITREAAREEAFTLEVAYSQYYAYVSGYSGTKEELQATLRDHLLFAPIARIEREGITETPGFRVPEASRGPLPPERIDRLYASFHALYLEYQLGAELAAQPNPTHNRPLSPELRPIAEAILADPLTPLLLKARREGRIDEWKLRSLLQELSFWRAEFRNWEIAGIERLGDQGEPLSMDEIRDEIAVEVLGSAQTP